MNKSSSNKFFITTLIIISSAVQSQTITTIAGVYGALPGYSGDGGLATLAKMYNPQNITIDSGNNLYISDSGNSCIRKVSANGIISTFAGNGTFGFSGDGGLALNAQLWNAKGVAVDTFGNVYIADEANNRIRVVNNSGIISTFAGTGMSGFNGDGGLAVSAKLSGPTDVEVDLQGNIYIADNGNNRIRKVDQFGIITTIAGTGVSGNAGEGGPATLAQLYYPTSVAMNTNGELFITEKFSNKLRKIDLSGNINTIAGTGMVGFSGDGGLATLAKLAYPVESAISNSGNIYIADNFNNRIRSIDPMGIISTFAGGGSGFDGGLAVNASLSGPNGVCLDSYGNIYISDTGHNCIRKVSLVNGINDNTKINLKVINYPNPANDIMYFSQEVDRIEIYDALGQKVLSQLKPLKEISVFELKDGVYFVKVGESMSKFIVKH